MGALRQIPQGSDLKINLVFLDGSTGSPINLTTGLDGIHIKIMDVDGVEVVKYNHPTKDDNKAISIDDATAGECSYLFESNSNKNMKAGNSTREIKIEITDAAFENGIKFRTFIEQWAEIIEAVSKSETDLTP